MYYQLKGWPDIASTFNSHPLIFQQCRGPIRIMNDRRHTKQDDEFLKRFLINCDLSGERIDLHQNELKSVMKNQIKTKWGVKYTAGVKLLGKKCMERKLEGEIRKKNLIGEKEYPLMEKPKIKIISGKTLHFQYISELEVYKLDEMEEERLLKIAKDYDILLIGGDSEDDKKYTDDKICIMKALSVYKDHKIFPFTITDAHVRTRIKYIDRKMFLEKPTKLNNFEYDLCYGSFRNSSLSRA